MKLKYTMDNRAAKEMLAQYPKAMQKAMTGAVTKTALKVRTAIDSAIRQTSGLKKKDLSHRSKGRRRLEVQYATVNNPTAFIIASGRPIPLMQYSAKWPGVRSPGVSSTAPTATTKTRSVGGALVPGAFIAKGSGGGRQVFIREPWPGGKRLPISLVFGPSVAYWFDAVNGEAIVVRVVATEYPGQLQSQLAFQLGKVGISVKG